MNKVFYWCVELLKDWAAALGTSYEAINVWIFVIIEPIVFLLMLWIILRQRKKIKNLSLGRA